MTWRFSGGTTRARRDSCAPPARRRASSTASSGRRRAQKRRRRSLPSTLARERVTCLSHRHSVTSRRTRCSAATVARARIVSRSPGRRSSRRELARRARRVEVDEPDRLLRRAAARPGDAVTDDRDIGAEPLARAARHRGRGLRRHGAVRLAAASAGTPSSACLDLVRVRDDRRRGTRRSSPGTDVSRAATSPPVHDSAVASVSPRSRHSVEHELLDRRLRRARRDTRSSGVDERAPRARRRAPSAPGSTKRSTWISKSRAQIVTSTPSPSPPAAASACGDRRLADAVEAAGRAARAAGARASSRRSGSVSSARGQSCCSSRGGPGSATATQPLELEDERRARCRRARPTIAPSGTVACLRDARRRSRRTAGAAARRPPRERASISRLERRRRATSGRPAARASSSTVRSSWVGPRPPETTSRSCASPVAQRLLELRRRASPTIAHLGRLDPEREQRPREERAVAGRCGRRARAREPVTTMRGARAGQLGRATPFGVTVTRAACGRQRARACRRRVITRFSGELTSSQKRLPWNGCVSPRSIVPSKSDVAGRAAAAAPRRTTSRRRR